MLFHSLRSSVFAAAPLFLACVASAQTVFTSNTLIGAGDMSFENQDIVVRGCTVTIDGVHTFRSLVVERSSPANVAGVVTHTAASVDGGVNGVYLTITEGCMIQGTDAALVGSMISVSGRGHPSTTGPGAGGAATTGAGGGHGGVGGATAAAGGVSYGDPTSPVEFGSGGGRDTNNGPAGGAGGGCLRLTVGGTLTIDGAIRADGLVGTGSQAGGGSGGSIWITAGAMTGVGAIGADGGNASQSGSGGAGGRIVIDLSSGGYGGPVTTFGGEGTQRGGAGTVMRRTNGATGDLSIENTGVSAITPIPASLTLVANASVTNAIVRIDHPMTLQSNLVVSGGGDVSHSPDNATGLTLTVGGDVTIEAGSSLQADGRGFPSTTGPGEGGDATSAGGGGYGGDGGSSGGAGGLGYGSVQDPTMLGSGGGRDTNNGPAGGAGGGLIHLRVNGTLTVNGVLSASGANGTGSDAGGGSGGSLNIATGTLAGTGVVRADGGAQSGNGAGGGGGRIALASGSSPFSGTIGALGGGAVRRGGAGTIYLVDTSVPRSMLVIDNGAVAGARTYVPGSFVGSDDCVIAGRSLVFADHLLTFDTCDIDGESVVTHTAAAGEGLHVAASDLHIGAGSTMSADGKGFPSTSGPGEGSDGVAAGGGGYGGRGANAGAAQGGQAYGSVDAPTDLGSGGGRDTNDGPGGGAGGGRIRLSVTGTLTCDGAVEADGNPGTGSDAGGGSGGTIVIATGAMSGSGRIGADGGIGTQSGGGGSGGRIAITRESDAFAGTVSTFGGTGAGGVRGGAGTIFTKQPADTLGDLSVMNAGAGAVTPLPSAFDAADHGAIGGGAILLLDHEASFESLDVGSAASITHTAQRAEGLRLVIGGDMSVGADAIINANGLGFPSSEGPGQGGDGAAAGGAGHGGMGGHHAGGAGGGPVYGDEFKPSLAGSGGGRDTNNGAAGGAGGGIVRLVVGGTLTVDGIVRTDGLPGTFADAGGGSGGSVLITAGSLAGSGTITSTGGLLGQSGGSGGGGRIAVYSCDVTLPPTNIVALGGGGARPGMAGTVYFGSGSIEITEQPADLEVRPGEDAVMHVEATGDGALSYQWRRRDAGTGAYDNLLDGGRISGATSDTLTISGVECGDDAVYDVVVTDSCGAFPSNGALLVVDALGDFNDDGGVDGADVEAFFAAWEGGDFSADVNQDGGIDGADVETFFAAWEAGGCA